MAAICEKLLTSYNVEDIPSCSSSSSSSSTSFSSSLTYRLPLSSERHTKNEEEAEEKEEYKNDYKTNVTSYNKRKQKSQINSKVKIKEIEKTDDTKNEVVHRGSVNNVQHLSSQEITNDEIPRDNSCLSFEDFTAGPLGASLHSAYEKAKEALIENKSTQRQIVVVLNKLKLCIDDLESQLNVTQFIEVDCNEEKTIGVGEGKEGEEEGKEDVKGKGEGEGERKIDEIENNNCDDRMNAINTLSSDLACARRDYRLSSKELRLCKLQVLEIQTLKKLSLSTLLQAFESQNNM